MQNLQTIVGFWVIIPRDRYQRNRLWYTKRNEPPFRTATTWAVGEKTVDYQKTKFCTIIVDHVIVPQRLTREAPNGRGKVRLEYHSLGKSVFGIIRKNPIRDIVWVTGNNVVEAEWLTELFELTDPIPRRRQYAWTCLLELLEKKHMWIWMRIGRLFWRDPHKPLVKGTEL